MESTVSAFNELHQAEQPLLIGNVWDAQSAKVFENLNFKAIATSSAAVAETLGYADGEQMSFDEYLFMIRRIKAATKIPLSIDLETGYGTTPEQIVDNIKQLVNLGIVGINIEDSIPSRDNRTISEAVTFAKKLREIKNLLQQQNVDLFINVRCDAFLLPLPDARKEAIERLRLYQDTGVQGVFLPCITNLEDIKAVVQAIELPLNVMCMPGLPNFNSLKSAGVKRISMGNFLNKRTYANVSSSVKKILQEQNFESIFQE